MLPSASLFQSTCPARGTTIICGVTNFKCRISIHVPREGHDRPSADYPSAAHDFNPRAPRGARPRMLARLTNQQNYFNPRAPRGARPGDITAPIAFFTISIHVPREGHDYLISKPAAARKIFQSTCPARGTTWLYNGAGIF